MARRELVLSCALIGALGGALLGYVFARTGRDWTNWHWELVLVLAVCTALSATLLGAFLARAGERAAARAAWATFVAGAINGVLVVLGIVVTDVAPSHDGLTSALIAGMIAGVVCAVPFAPATITVAATAAWNDARTGSIAARSQGRCVIRNALVSLGLAAALIIPDGRGRLVAHLPAYVLALTLLGSIALYLAERAVDRTLVDDGQPWEPAADNATADHAIDYGVGFDVVIRRAYDETYREEVRAAELRRGNPHRVRELVSAAARGHAAAAILAAMALTLTITSASP